MRAISISRMLAIYANEHGCTFTLEGQPEPAVLLFSQEVFLPILAFHADLEARQALGHGLEVDFTADPDSLMGVAVNVPPLTGDEMSVLRAAFFAKALHTIFGLSKDVQTIECEPVFHAYQNGLLAHIEENGALTWPVATTVLRA